MPNLRGKTRVRKANPPEGFTCRGTNGLCGQRHPSLREACLCCELTSDAAEAAGRFDDAWPVHFSEEVFAGRAVMVLERVEIAEYAADPAVNGPDFDAGRKVMRAEVGEARIAELTAAAVARFASKPRARRRPSAEGQVAA